jgi:glycosyltransferase involved in cell wall biosynthesis
MNARTPVDLSGCQTRASQTGRPAVHPARPRIGIVDMETETSGITRYVRALLDGIDRREFELTLFCRPAGPYQARDELQDVIVVHVPPDPGSASSTPIARSGGLAVSGRWKDPFRSGARRVWRGVMPQTVKHAAGFLRDARRLAGFFQAHPVDLLHFQVVSNSKAAVAARWAKIPHRLATYHLDPKRARLHQWLPEVLTTRSLDHGIAVSENTRAAWAARPGMRPSQLSVIPNGVDVDRYRHRSNRQLAREALGLGSVGPVVAVVARLEPQKGHRHLIDAVAELASTFPRLTLLLAGDGTLRPELEAQARDRGIGGNVRFLGHRADVRDVLEAADVFVLPSLWEAMPFALLEAMASGLPVVATGVAGVPELVADGRTGYLVPPADAGALAFAVRRVLASGDRGAGMGEAGRERVERHFALERMLEETQSAYQRLLHTRPRR